MILTALSHGNHNFIVEVSAVILFDSSVKISLFYLILSNLDNRFLRVFDPIYRILLRKPVLLSIHKTLTGMTKTIKWLDLPQYESAY